MDAIGFGWKVVTKRFSTVALPLALGIVVYAVLANGVSLGGGFAVGFLTERGLLDSSLAPIASMSVSGFGAIFSFVVASFMLGGLTSTALKAARGQPTSFGDPFSGGRFMVPFLVALIVGTIAVSIGMVLCLVPGIILSIGLCFQGCLIVDQNLAGVDALKKSWEMTKGHKLNIFIFGLLGFCVYLAGVLACGLGALLISAPLLFVALAWIYLRIKGEAVPEPT
jgi:uncharacterized membrane protein